MKIKRVFLITVDCLRADHVGCIGQGRLTPNIDRLARDGIDRSLQILFGECPWLSLLKQLYECLNNGEFISQMVGAGLGLRDVSYERFLRADLEKYRGFYIAIVDGLVVECGEDPEKIYTKAREKYPKKEVILWKVPKEETLIL